MVVHVPIVLSDDIETVRTAAGPALSRYAGLTNYRGMFEIAGFQDAAGGDLNALIDAVAVYGSDETSRRGWARSSREARARSSRISCR